MQGQSPLRTVSIRLPFPLAKLPSYFKSNTSPLDKGHSDGVSKDRPPKRQVIVKEVK